MMPYLLLSRPHVMLPVNFHPLLRASDYTICSHAHRALPILTKSPLFYSTAVLCTAALQRTNLPGESNPC